MDKERTKINLQNGYSYPAGDFRSRECIELLKEADIVVTNPPFSLWRKFLAQLMEYDKKFLIIGKLTHISKKEIFPLVKDNKIWLGISLRKKKGEFYVKDYDRSYGAPIGIDENGYKYRKIYSLRWFTNLKTAYKQPPLDMREVYYTPEKYPKYDNYDAINVDKVENIPCDYPSVMGVPLSFIDKYCPEQFELLGITDSGSLSGNLRTLQYVNPILHKSNGSMANGNAINGWGPCIKMEKTINTDIYYTADNCDYKLKHLYDRILIRNKHLNKEV